MDGRVITFGESLLRLSPPNHLRWRQTHVFESFFGGAEANVAVSLACFGVPVQHVTCLPDNDLGVACLQSLRQYGVGTDYIHFSGERLGLYFLETGSDMRPSRVLYDRAHSSFATMDEDAISWSQVFAQGGWFHWSGINPAVSATSARATAKAVESARDNGFIISCDLNYRHSLWQWGASPSSIMPDLVEQCDVLVANTASLMLGLPNLPAGRTLDEAREILSRLSGRYPQLKQIAMTCRGATSAENPQYTGVLWHAGHHYTSPTYVLNHIVDRVGAGDAFMAGLIYGLLTYTEDPQRIVDFATACAAIKHSIPGDANIANVEEIAHLRASRKGFDIIR